MFISQNWSENGAVSAYFTHFQQCINGVKIKSTSLKNKKKCSKTSQTHR